MIFDSWFGLFRVLVVGVSAYAVLVLFLRLSGKRTLAKLNAFDLVVTVALGSTLSSIILSKSVALLEGVLAMALLIVLQLVITWLAVHSSRFNRMIKSEPTLLVSGGDFLESAMMQQRVARDDVLAAIRSQGVDDVARVDAVILETDGSLSVIAKR